MLIRFDNLSVESRSIFSITWKIVAHMTLFCFFLSFESESEGASESVIIVCRESEEFGERLVLKLIVTLS